jgi:hypothetical protein
MKKQGKKLVLAKETVGDLAQVAGSLMQEGTKTIYWSVVCESGSCPYSN